MKFLLLSIAKVSLPLPSLGAGTNTFRWRSYCKLSGRQNESGIFFRFYFLLCGIRQINVKIYIVFRLLGGYKKTKTFFKFRDVSLKKGLGFFEKGLMFF